MVNSARHHHRLNRQDQCTHKSQKLQRFAETCQKAEFLYCLFQSLTSYQAGSAIALTGGALMTNRHCTYWECRTFNASGGPITVIQYQDATTEYGCFMNSYVSGGNGQVLYTKEISNFSSLSSSSITSCPGNKEGAYHTFFFYDIKTVEISSSNSSYSSLSVNGFLRIELTKTVSYAKDNTFANNTVNIIYNNQYLTDKTVIQNENIISNKALDNGIHSVIHCDNGQKIEVKMCVYIKDKYKSYRLSNITVSGCVFFGCEMSGLPSPQVQVMPTTYVLDDCAPWDCKTASQDFTYTKKRIKLYIAECLIVE